MINSSIACTRNHPPAARRQRLISMFAASFALALAIQARSDEGSTKLHESMMKGMQQMQGMSMTGETDKDFASMMIHHHQQAIEMSRTQLAHGKDPQVRRAAEKIIADSQRDIKELQGWLDHQGSAKKMESNK